MSLCFEEKMQNRLGTLHMKFVFFKNFIAQLFLQGKSIGKPYLSLIKKTMLLK